MLDTLFSQYWNIGMIETNFIIFLNLLGALLLGMLLGSERAYQGRAAGMRTYGLVCMASCALTVFSGYSHFWWGSNLPSGLAPDPTRVIQGIVSGIGFLGAGVIMKDGFTISGLSTAASIWMCSAIGILIGVGFYGASIMLTFLAIFGMLFFPKLEQFIPQKQAIVVHLVFKPDFNPLENKIREKTLQNGYDIPKNGISINFKKDKQEWNFIAISFAGKKCSSIPEITELLTKTEGIESFSISPSRH